MKKLICLFIFLILVFSMISCKNNGADNNGNGDIGSVEGNGGTNNEINGDNTDENSNGGEINDENSDSADADDGDLFAHK